MSVKELGDELAVLAGVLLLLIALWPAVGRLALAIPGLVCLWIALPSRSPFVSPPSRTRERAK